MAPTLEIAKELRVIVTCKDPLKKEKGDGI
jgi:hypothetical protein